MMELRSLLRISVPLMIVTSLMCIMLPKEFATMYVFSAMSVLLMSAVILSTLIAYGYTDKQLRKTYFYLAFFLLILFLANINEFWIMVYSAFGYWEFIPMIIARIAYIPLVLSRMYTVRVIKIKPMNLYERLMVLLILAVIVMSVMLPVLPVIASSLESQEYLKIASPIILLRILDLTIVTVLLPVLFLNMHQFKLDSKSRVTLSIATVISGIIIATIVDYPYSLLMGISHQDIGQQFQTGTMYDALLIMSYFMISLGLYVHLRYDEWTQRIWEKEAMGKGNHE